jgi:hypothetical protein
LYDKVFFFVSINMDILMKKNLGRLMSNEGGRGGGVGGGENKQSTG